MRRKVFAWVTGSNSRHLLILSMGKVLSIFVDESGRFQFPDANSRFYILGLVLHDQSQPVDGYVADLQRAEDEIGLEGHCFHAGPLIRKEKGYEFMSRKLAWTHTLAYDGVCTEGAVQIPLSGRR